MKNGIQTIFSGIPKTYELINHLLTFGFDIHWRKKAARLALSCNGTRHLDLCTGTGETAIHLRKFSKGRAKVFAVDFTLPMMMEGVNKPKGDNIRWSIADVKQLPFKNNTFDVLILSFATRNINLNRETLIRTFSEFRRILKPGGSYINVETSQPNSVIIRKLFHLFISIFVKPVGNWISGSKFAYTYLSKTIPAFYNAKALADILMEAGFRKVSFQKMMFGVSAIHQAEK